MTTIIHLTLLLLLGMAGIALGLNKTEGSTKNEQHAIRISSLGEWNGGPLFVREGLEKTDPMNEVGIIDMGYSPNIPFKPGQAIQFFKKTSDEETPYQLVLSVTVPAAIKMPLILLISRNDKITYQTFDLDPNTFPYGSYQMVNYSTQQLKVAIDQNIKALEPYQRHIFAAARVKAKTAWLRASIESQRKLVFSSMTTQRAGKRMIVFFLNGDNKELIRTRMLVDFQPASAP